MKKQITKYEIEQKVKEWFECDWNSTFTSKPKTYIVEIDHEDCIYIRGEWEDGTSDFCGLGNMYKFLWERGL